MKLLMANGAHIFHTGPPHILIHNDGFRGPWRRLELISNSVRYGLHQHASAVPSDAMVFWFDCNSQRRYFNIYLFLLYRILRLDDRFSFHFGDRLAFFLFLFLFELFP